MSYDEGGLEVHGFEFAELHEVLGEWLDDAVDAQAVFGEVDFVEQFGFEGFHQGGVNLAFKHGFLHPLPVVEAHFGNPAQPSAAFAGFGGDIIGHQYQHGFVAGCFCKGLPNNGLL